MTAMGRSGIKRLSLKKDDVELTLERGDFVNGRPMDSFESLEEAARSSVLHSRVEHSLKHQAELPANYGSNIASELPKQEIAGTYITSPMVGTYYSTPDPEEPPFVRVGDKVEKNTVVCIIEAMKVMNEIKAGAIGTIAEVLIEAGQPVEFGAKLFRII